MAEPVRHEQARERANDESFGVLVGWTHSEFNDKLALRLQSTRSSNGAVPGHVDSCHFLMTRNQALVLANYLFEVTGQEPVRRPKRSWFARLFGG